MIFDPRPGPPHEPTIRFATGPLADRLPPHNLRAEMGCLGSILLDPDAIHEIRRHVRPEDFYRDDHAELYRILLEMADDAKPLDAISVDEELTTSGQFDELGSRDLLRGLLEATPNPADGEYYAQIVRQKAVGRELIGLANQMLRDAYSGMIAADDLVEEAQRAVLAIGEGRMGEETSDAHGAVTEALGGLADRDAGIAPGLSTGFAGLDRMTGGLQPGHLIVIAARPSIGKAQPLDAKVLTPAGFVEMGSIKVGDSVIGSSGQACRVTGVFPRGELPVYRVTFSDGSSTRCCEEHLWFTETRNERRRGNFGSVKTLREIMRTLEREGGSANHAIPSLAPVYFDDQPWPDLDPYAMGALLGDGTLGSHCIQFTNPEADVCRRLSERLPIGDVMIRTGEGINYRIKRHQRTNGVSFTRAALGRYGLEGASSKAKFIPPEYLFGSLECRIALLRGLLDTDGHVNSEGQSVEYTTSSPRLAEDVASLVRSLGGIVSTRSRVPVYTHRGEKKRGSVSARLLIRFPNAVLPVSSDKHLLRWRSVIDRKHRRSIVAVEPIDSAECQCITVDSSDRLYVTDDFILTHNSALALNIAEHVALPHRRSGRGPTPVLFASLEMSRRELGDRLLCGRAGVDGFLFRHSHRLLDEHRDRLARAAEDLSAAPIAIDDSASRTITQLATIARRLKSRRDLGLLVVDYLQLVQPEAESARRPRHEIVAEFSARFKGLAKELNIPILLLSQLNREVEKREDKRPQLADIRESGAVEQDANLILLLHRPEFYDEKDRPGQAEVIVAKNRSGPTGIIRLAFDRRTTRFSDHVEEGC